MEVDDEPDCWRFSHPLSRRVTAARLSRGRRARLHQRIGETLESRFGVSPAELAHHFGAAASIGSAEKAVRYERLAAEQALAEVAAEVAVRHLRKALQLADRFGPRDQALRCELLLELAGAHDRAGEYASRDERFAEAADAARRLGNGELFLRAALGYGGILPATVSPDQRAEALLEEALKELGEEDSAARATILARLAHWLHNERPYPERLELSDRSLAMARGTGDRRTLATVLMHRGWALDGPDDVDDALAVASEILGIGAELGDPELRLEGLRIRVTAQFEKGEHRAAVRTALAMKELAEEVRHPEFIRLSAMWDVTLANLEGRFADAKELADELGRRLARIGHSQAQIIPVAQTFPWWVLRGRSSNYLPTLQELSAYEPANIAWPAITAWCLAETGALDQAADLLHRTTPERGGRGGQELPVVGRDRGFLRRRRPGRRPAVGRGPLRSRRSLRRAQLHAGGGDLSWRRGPLARCARGGSRPLHRGHRAPGGRAYAARRHGVAAADCPHPGGLRPCAVDARRGGGHRTGTRAQRRPRARTAEELGLAAISDRLRSRG